MAKATRICKVCGREYEYCHTARQTAGGFRWQDVACSPEHGSIYFARVLESRSKENKVLENKNTISPKRNDSEYDELFEEDFDDNDEEPVIQTK